MFRHILTSLLATVSLAQADLVWDKPVQEFHSTPEDKSVTAKFSFKNTGKEPITIKRVTTSCGCTSAKLGKNTFAPGESGEVEVKFTFGSRRGAQRKIISVTGEDKKEWRLDLRCWINEALTISPTLVYWKSGTPAEAKTVKVVSASGQKVGIKSVTSTNPQIKATLKTVKDGEEYAILVTPVDTAQSASAEVVVETDTPSDSPKTYKVYARVK